jgi:N6-L-threonylcarbamoyladenine synthase
MSKKPLILGIESSCDETAASIITENEQGIPIVLSNIVSSQVDVHKEFGGVVPELAARSHMEKIDWIVQKAIDDSGRKNRRDRCNSLNGWSRSNSSVYLLV